MVTVNPLDNIKKRINSEETEAWAAVAIILKDSPNGLEILLVKRAEIPGDPWSGDMAFPGGKKSGTDANLRATVHREVLEETGINLDETVFIGTMSTVFSALRNEMSVLPILYQIKNVPEINLNSELTKYMWITLKELDCLRSVEKVKRWEGPVFKIGDDLVWGLTYRILNELLKIMKETN